MEWKAVSEYPNYEVNEIGEVRRIKAAYYTRSTKVRYPAGYKPKPSFNTRGYVKYCLVNKDGKEKNVEGHRLVALAFLSKPDGKNVVCHKDGCKVNNTVENLYWGTSAENSADKLRHGTQQLGQEVVTAKLSAQDVGCIRACRKEGIKLKPLAEWFGVNYRTISACSSGQSWNWLD